jgi:predicted nucleic-acid-binding protein
VLVRLFVADDQLQGARAAKLVATEQSVFVSKTVVLEYEWVLSAVYATPRPGLIHALQTLAGLEKVELEDRTVVEQAIALFIDGFEDFADALHLCSSKGATTFATFDRRLIAKARKFGGSIHVRAP